MLLIILTHAHPAVHSTHHALLIDGDVRCHEVDIAPSTIYHGRVCVRSAKACPSARDEAAQPSDSERVSELSHDVLHEWTADLVAAHADESDAVLGVEASKLCGREGGRVGGGGGGGGRGVL